MAHFGSQMHCPSCGFYIQTNQNANCRQSEVDADSETARSVTACLGRARDLENYGDFTVLVGNQSFKCHKLILGSCSEFFAALLRSDMQEKARGAATVKGMTADTFRLILDSIYKGKSILTIKNMLHVWQGAHQLQIEFLIKACEDFIVKKISTKNYLDVYQVANLLESVKVKGAVHELMINNFSTVMKSKTFPDLPPGCLVALVSCKTLSVSKDIAVKAILAWVRGTSFDHHCGADGDYAGQFQGYCVQDLPPDIQLSMRQNTLMGLPNNTNMLFTNGFESSIRAFGVRPKDATEEQQRGRQESGATFGQSAGVDESKEIPPEHKWRQDHLVQLLQAVNLDEISDDCISVLMNDQTVLDCVEALRIVSRIAAKRLSGRQGGQNVFRPIWSQ